jgi:hypothetical protein
MSLRKISWAFYVVGLAIVAASWVNIVDAGIGWIGWVIGMIGWGLGFLPAAKRESLADEIARLERMHADGTLSDEEFQVAKESVLRTS